MALPHWSLDRSVTRPTLDRHTKNPDAGNLPLVVRPAATRMAELQGEPVGQTEGYWTRFEARLSQQTCIGEVTEGIHRLLLYYP